MGVGFAILFTKRHRAEPKSAYLKRAVGDTVVLHKPASFYQQRQERVLTKEYKNGRGEEKGEVKNKKGQQAADLIC
ncbi:hypothetical protein ACLK2H_16005 [Escherichia coli]